MYGHGEPCNLHPITVRREEALHSELDFTYAVDGFAHAIHFVRQNLSRLISM